MSMTFHGYKRPDGLAGIRNHVLILPVLRGEMTIEAMGQQVFDEIVRIASGKKTKAEIHGFGFSEVVMRRACDYV
jgi:altronate dehydratase